MDTGSDLGCNASLRQALQDRLARFDVNHAPEAEASGSAVALTVVEAGHGAGLDGLPHHPDWQGEAALVLTRRAFHLRRHAGQWALPGGRIDPGETPERTALRELHEEVALEVPAENILGRLDDFVTRSGFVMTPIVVWGGRGLEMEPNPDEVRSIHRIPLAEFLRDDAPQLSEEVEDSEPVLRMPVGSSYIAAPTAAILYQFREVALLGRSTRVAHYEQPRFAWK